MNVHQAVVTFTNGTAVALSTLFSAYDKCAKLLVEPDVANANVCYVGDASLALGTSTVNHVIKVIAKPTAADAELDSFELEDSGGNNSIVTSEYKFDGTTNQKARVTIWVN